MRKQWPKSLLAPVVPAGAETSTMSREEAATKIQAMFRGFLTRRSLRSQRRVLEPEHVVAQLQRHRTEKQGFVDLCLFLTFAAIFIFVMEGRIRPSSRFHFEVRVSVPRITHQPASH